MTAISNDHLSPGGSSFRDAIGGGETFQHYQVLRRPDGRLWELGRGAMGVTYKAFDTNLRCHVALKVISAQHLHSEIAGQRFIREARVAAQLRHRNIATVYHLGVDPQGFFYSMEFIDGETLETLVERTGPLPVDAVLSIGLQTARALAAASRQGLIHRDLKPANIMVQHRDEDNDERLLVKVIDFGLARSYDPGDSNAQLTATGFVGTPLYASPEQLEEKDLDGRSDIYSLGVTLWILLTGRPPFQGKLTQVIAQHLSAEPPWWQLGACREPARTLLERMLKKDPAERFQNANELRAAIEACLWPSGSGGESIPLTDDPDRALRDRNSAPLRVAGGGTSASGTAVPLPAWTASPAPRSGSGRITFAPFARTRVSRQAAALWARRRFSHLKGSHTAALVVLILCGLGFFYWHGSSGTLEAKPVAVHGEFPSPVERPAAAPAQTSSLASYSSADPHPASESGGEPAESVAVAAEPAAFQLREPIITSGPANLAPADEPPSPADTPSPDPVAPVPGSPHAEPAAVGAPSTPAEKTASGGDEAEDDPAAPPAKRQTKGRSATHSRRSRATPTPQPNFFQKLFGIKAKGKPK